MHIKVSGPEPLILHDAVPGNLFLIHEAGLEEGVFCLLDTSNFAVVIDKSRRYVVAIGCRVGRADLAHIPAGMTQGIRCDTPITLLEQLSSAGFRCNAIPASISSPDATAPPDRF